MEDEDFDGFEKFVELQALKNAVKYGGEAEAEHLIGAIMGEFPGLRGKNEEVLERAEPVVERVNSLPVEEQKELLKEKHNIIMEKENKGEVEGGEGEPGGDEKRELKELPRAEDGEVVMRFEPSPSGPMHIGHTYALLLSYHYCTEYDGELILRIADTNPENIYEPAYDLLVEDFNWLCPDVEKEVFVQSERMELYYEYALKLIKKGKAYICRCSAEKFREFSKNKEECPCRSLEVEQNVDRWEMMKTIYDPGDAVLRLKTEMAHKNPAMRDFPLARINTTTHPKKRKRYRIWPLMNLAVTVDDIEMGVTHIIRGKDHMDNAKRQEIMFEYLDEEYPVVLFTGRINFQGLQLSTSKTRAKIESNKYKGWEDPRLPFVQALKKRGYQPKSFLEFAKSMGLSETDKTVSKEEFFKSLNAFNKELIEPEAYRFFMVRDPVEITVEGAPEQKLELDLHPDHKDGGRLFWTNEEFIIEREDFDEIEEGEVVRLKDCLNFKKVEDKFVFHSGDYESFKGAGERIVHWLPASEKNELNTAEVKMPDGTIKSGPIESKALDIVLGDVVQAERFGFMRLTEKNGSELVFHYAHR